MHIAILSFGGGWHVRDLQRAAALRGHVVTLHDFRRVQGRLPGQGTSLDGCDVVVVRTMPPGSLEQVVFRMDLLHRLVARGVRVINSPVALESCIDKYLASAKLDAARLPVPPTITCQDADSAMQAFADLSGDVVVKPLFGSEGRGIVRVADPEIAWRTFRAIERMGSVLYLQQFIHHPGWDLRAFVLGGKVLAAMRRHGKGSWRTNIAQGGRAEAVSLTREEEQMALAAARVVGTDVAGIDLLPRPEGGYYVLEVNAVPGWRALRAATGVDVAAAVVEHIGG